MAVVLATRLRLSFGVKLDTVSRYSLYPLASRRMVTPPMVFGSPVRAAAFAFSSSQVSWTWLSSGDSTPLPVAFRFCGTPGVVPGGPGESVTAAHGGDEAGAQLLEFPAESFASTWKQYVLPVVRVGHRPCPRKSVAPYS